MSPQKSKGIPQLNISAKARGKSPSISLCMMVKNEEKRLPTALKSAAPWVDEIIVVDTGSSDRTMEIAREYGAKIFESPWRYDFSFHRNETIEHASGDWVLILDADEELDQETATLIKPILSSPEIEANHISCILFELHNHLTAGGKSFMLHPRLFRRGKISYAGPVHNRPTFVGNHAAAPVKLIHYGYNDDPQTMAAKHQRRLDMIGKWVENEPENFMARSYYAQTLVGERENAAEALEHAQKARRLAQAQNASYRELPRFYYPMILSLLYLSRDQELLDVVDECMKQVPAYPDPLYYGTWVNFQNKNYEKVCQDAAEFQRLQENCLTSPMEFRYFENLSFEHKYQVYLRWCVAAARLKDLNQADRVLQLIFKEEKAEESCQETLRELTVSGDLEAVSHLLPQIREFGPDWQWLDSIEKAVEKRGAAARSQKHEAAGEAAAEKGDLAAAASAYQAALVARPTQANLMTKLGMVLAKSGRQAEAKTWLVKGLGLGSQHPEAWKVLGDLHFADSEHEAAYYFYNKYARLTSDQSAVAGRLKVCQRRVLQNVRGPSVAQKPPQLLAIMAEGMSHAMVTQAAPSLLRGRAWGQFLSEEGQAPDGPGSWARILTGGLAQTADPATGGPAHPGIWQVLAENGLKVGLAAAPLTPTAPAWAAWSLPGRGQGQVGLDTVWPASLLPPVLAAGYRPDYVTDEDDEELVGQTLRVEREMARLMQLERRKVTTALSLPAVDVLVIGVTALDYVHRAMVNWPDFRQFSAYQNFYAWLEMFLAAPGAENFAILSNRGYEQGQSRARAGGFYCLSWMAGENLKGRPADVAPQILSLLRAGAR